MTDSSDKYKKFDQVLADLKSEIDRLAVDGSQLGPLNRAYDALKQKSDDIRGLEQHISSVQREIIAPVNQSLRKSNWLGIGFGIVGVISLGVSFFQNPNGEAIDSINSTLSDARTSIQAQAEAVTSIKETESSQQRMLADLQSMARAQPVAPSEYKPVEGEQHLPIYQRREILRADGHSIEFRLTNVRQDTPEGAEPQLVGEFEIYEDGGILGKSAIDRRVNVRTPWNRLEVAGSGQFLVYENDVIVLDEIHPVAVTRLTAEAALFRENGDGASAAYLLPQPRP